MRRQGPQLLTNQRFVYDEEMVRAPSTPNMIAGYITGLIREFYEAPVPVDWATLQIRTVPNLMLNRTEIQALVYTLPRLVPETVEEHIAPILEAAHRKFDEAIERIRPKHDQASMLINEAYRLRRAAQRDREEVTEFRMHKETFDVIRQYSGLGEVPISWGANSLFGIRISIDNSIKPGKLIGIRGWLR